MILTMRTIDENREVSLNHKNQGAPHGGASCRDSVLGDLHCYPGVSILGEVLRCFIGPANRGNGSSMRFRATAAICSARHRLVPFREMGLLFKKEQELLHMN
jgi:hypothetical protein